MKRSNLLLMIMIFFGSCECSQEPLGEVLGNPCYTDEDGNAVEVNKNSQEYLDRNLGICSTGKTSRNKQNTLICVEEIQPEAEECNGLDDNCNGFVDDDYTGGRLAYQYYENRNTCVAPGVCRYATQRCVEGVWTCEYPSSYGQEVCDGLDNDCDGTRDEDTSEEPIFDGDRYVYTADPDTINIGECRAGYKECVDGNVYIRNMRTPIPEVCGNDDDDDCDGLTDEVENDSSTSDYALIIDYSGSMSNIINSVADALCQWSSQGVLQNSRFAVVAIGYVNNSGNDEMKVLTDFTDSSTACRIIRQNNIPAYAGGIEYQLDATYNSNDASSISGYVNWASDNRRVIIFSDELLQQNFQPTIVDAVEAVVQQCQEIGYTVSAFITYNIQDQLLWSELTQRCGGFLDYLSQNTNQMIEQLNYWIGSDC